MRNLIAAFLISFLLFASCKDNSTKIQYLNAELQGVTDTLNICQSARSFRLNKIDSLNNLVKGNASRIYTDSVDLSNYLSGHKMAVACIAGGYVSAKVKTDFDTEYPEVVEKMAGWGVALSIGYYLFNKDEVDEVVNRLNENNNTKTQLYSEIGTYQQNISDERSYLADITNIESAAQNKASIIRQEIDSLR